VATFFLQSRWATAWPDVARRIARDGHLVGNHSKFHARLPLLSEEGLRADVREAEQEIREITGQHPRPWFRCPFGAGHDDPRIRAALEQLGYRNVHWDVEAEDWEDRSPEEICGAVVDGALRRGDGAVVLLHTWPRATAEALPSVIRDLRTRGVRFVTVRELENLP